MYILCTDWRQQSVVDRGKRTPPGRLARSGIHLKEYFDVEGDGGSRPFQPQPNGVRVRVRGSHQPNLKRTKEKTRAV